MIRRNASASNEAIGREQTIAELRRLARICKWATICITTALALGLLAVIAIDLLLILPGLSQGVVPPIRRTSSRRRAVPGYCRYRCAGPTYARRTRWSHCHRKPLDDMPRAYHRAKRARAFLQH